MSETTLGEMKSLSLWATPAGESWLAHALAGVAQDERIDWQPFVSAIREALTTAEPREAARLRHRLGYIAMLAGDVRPKAIEAFTMMLADAERLEDQALQGLAHCGLALALDHIGERHESRRHAEQAERLAELAGDLRLLGLALNGQAQFYKETGANARAHLLTACGLFAQ